MQKYLLILSVILLLAIAKSLECQAGEISVKQICIKCADIPHTQAHLTIQFFLNNKCECEEGYNWNSQQLRCQTGEVQLGNNIQNEDQLKENEIISTKRLLQTSCDTASGFIYYKQALITTNSIIPICFNCRLIPGSSHTAAPAVNTGGQPTCSCLGDQRYYSDWGTCYTYSNYPYYYDATLQRSVPCGTLPTTSLRDDCLNFKNQFVSTRSGKTYCPTIKNSVYNINCGCTTGYKFNFYTTRCQCANGYYRDGLGNCVICPTADKNICNSTVCTQKYINDKYSCVLGSTIGIPSTGTCPTGFVLKRNLFDHRIIGCGCSLSSKYFLNGNNCILCSNIATILPNAGITTTQCLSCSSSKLTKTTVQCVYCPNVANNLDGTGDINGCKCKNGYFWNINSAKCECDYGNGMIVDGNTCFDCKLVAGSQIFVYFPYNKCSCMTGFIWNPTTKTCICDTTGGNSFLIGTTCVNCLVVLGGNGKILGSNSCTCLRGYVWNSTTFKCDCDWKQNFVLLNNLCSECLTFDNSNGLANSLGQCTCLNGYKWNNGCVPCTLGTDLNVGGKCFLCSALSNLANRTACTSCTNNFGYALSNNVCYECIKQYGVNVSTVTNGLCTCPSSMTWAPLAGGCVCKTYSSSGMVWTYNSTLRTANKWTCQSWIFTNTSSCGGNPSTTRYILTYKICHICRNDPNNAVLWRSSTSNYCECRTGYILNLVIMPFGCVASCGFSNNLYISGTNCLSCINLSTTGNPSKDNCLVCATNGGFIQRVNNFGVLECIHCATIIGGGTTGAATESGCVCSTGKIWNPQQTKCL